MNGSSLSDKLLSHSKKIKSEYTEEKFEFEQTEQSLKFYEALYTANKNLSSANSKSLNPTKEKLTEIEVIVYSAENGGGNVIAGLIVINAFTIRNYLKGQEKFGDRLVNSFKPLS